MPYFVKLVSNFLCFSFVFSFMITPIWAGDKKDSCQIWPDQFPTSSDGYFNVYSGECQDGKADGKGVVSSYNTFTPDFDDSSLEKNKPVYIFEGYYRQGVFLGERYFKGKLLFNSNYVMTIIDKKNGDEVWLNASMERREPLNLCSARKINVAVSNYDQYKTDINKSKKILDEAYKKFLSLCPDFNQWVAVILVEQKDALIFNSTSGDIDTQFSDGNASHRNVFFERAQHKKKLDEEDKKRQEEINKVRDEIVNFFKRAKALELVTVEQLIKNPFRWKGKTVAVVVSLEEMLSASEAFVGSADSYYGRIFLSGIKPDYFKDSALLMVVKVNGKDKYDGASFTNMTYVSHRDCLVERCQEIEDVNLTNYTRND